MHNKQAFIYFLVLLRGNKVLWPATNMKEFRPSLSTKQQLLEWDERLLTVSDFTFSHHNYNYCSSVVYVSKLQASKPSKLIHTHDTQFPLQYYIPPHSISLFLHPLWLLLSTTQLCSICVWLYGQCYFRNVHTFLHFKRRQVGLL